MENAKFALAGFGAGSVLGYLLGVPKAIAGSPIHADIINNRMSLVVTGAGGYVLRPVHVFSGSHYDVTQARDILVSHYIWVPRVETGWGYPIEATTTLIGPYPHPTILDRDIYYVYFAQVGQAAMDWYYWNWTPDVPPETITNVHFDEQTAGWTIRLGVYFMSFMIVR